MKSTDLLRRELLKLSPFALAGSIPGVGGSKEPEALKAPGSLFDVRTYGATGDGKTVDTPAINKAIEAAAAAGGGTVFFPAGNYMCFSIRLKSNIQLFLAQGCTITAADSPLPGQTTGYNGGMY